MSLLTILYAFLGASLGSYVHATCGRLFVTSVNSRSKCLSCNTQLKWYEIIPLISYVVQGARCRYCKVKLPLSLFLFEVLFAILFVVSYVHIFAYSSGLIEQMIYTIYYGALFVCMGVIANFDSRHKSIPVNFLGIFAVLCALMLVYRNITDGFVLLDLFTPLIVAMPYYIMYLVSRGTWVGIGDVYLFACAGLFFPLLPAVSVFVFSLWIATAFLVVKYIATKIKPKSKETIAFGPFIMISFLVVLFTNYTLIDIVTLLNSLYTY